MKNNLTGERLPGWLTAIVHLHLCIDCYDCYKYIHPPAGCRRGNDRIAEKSFDRQLVLMRKVSPDIISLQESDTTRISMNNSDYVRYFAEHLGYHSYYGPGTVTGTYGTAILSRYPLENTRMIFSYSDTDEIGTTEAKIEVNGHRLTIYDVHPAGSASARLAFARTLLDQSRDRP